MTAVPAFAQGASTTNLGGIVPVAVVLGAGGFALVAVSALRKLSRDGRKAQRQSQEQIADLRALVDDYENLIGGSRELTVIWPEQPGTPPRLLGQAAAVLPPGRQPQSVLNFDTWLSGSEADNLAQLVEQLRVEGRPFNASVKALDGRLIRATGWLAGGGAALRLRPAFAQPGTDAPPTNAEDRESLLALLDLLNQPAFLRDTSGRLVFANQPYLDLCRALGKPVSAETPAELLDAKQLQAHLAQCRGHEEPVRQRVSLGKGRDFELVDVPVAEGRAGYLEPLVVSDDKAGEPSFAHIAGIIDALATPIAIFNARRELIQFNPAYAALWNLDRKFLTPGLDERAILDKLRTEGMLPNQVDYHTWRAKHLESYGRKAPFEAEPWHLPDGRTIKVISAPAGTHGGVIYVFEDLTERLELESANKAMTNVQRETINSLSEAVAVFGTNGRLTLSNPRLSALWKLPMNALGANPHIDQIADASGQVLPDGAKIWSDLKRNIIDLNPTRTDKAGRIERTDGRLLDYATTRLPDGQTMMTFLDVTESASYSKVLKERNDALVTADRLKDAFVENVSYELRSPLTNIIGFADLLAGTEGDSLNERQKAYIEYIRASSVTLGVLIDNILDLASVDAGIAELNPEPLDVSVLIDKARAGLSASFPEVSGNTTNLVVEVEPNLPEFIADGTRIVQVLYNLLSNAARFSPPGGEIRLSVTHRADRILFIIDDEGPGLTDELRSAILTRLDTPSAGGRLRGAGLGLSIVRTFVNLHGGTISAQQREPRGSRIVVNLPRDSALAGVAE
ncbi:PAS-domain containing protein [Devosia sp.]|uniref:sensor histidine kinase n=1 Tax=Devosia sp. TaxID=1871048 RepID=UPI001B1B9425|nr:PAS-domain containing protein [Devosia sp.]MBO9590216.1 PAS-domain containing protein [Devosia sp.]